MKNKKASKRVEIKSRFVNRRFAQYMSYQVYLDGKLYCGSIDRRERANEIADALIKEISAQKVQ